MKRAALLALGLLALLASPAAASEVQSFSLPSKLVDPSKPGGTLEKHRTAPKVNVLLPDGYRARGSRRYPVLWLLHGANGGTDTWFGNNDVRKLAAGLPAIIVMPDGGVAGFYTDWWNGGRRGDPAWASYHLDLLRRVIEHRYRIRPGRRWHSIGGISMGGGGALRYAALLPGYFGSVVGLSAAFPDMQGAVVEPGINGLLGNYGVSYQAIFGPRTGFYAEGNSPQALATNYAHTRMYLTSGNGTNCPQDPHGPTFALDAATEAVINAQQGPFAAAVGRAGADVTAVTTCGVHTFGVWDRAFVKARAWGLFRAVPEQPRRWAYRTVASHGEMWGLNFEFAKPPAAIATFRRSGGTLAASGRGRVRIVGLGRCRLSARLPFKRQLPDGCDRL